MTKTRGMTSVDTIQIDDFPWVLAPGEFGYWRLRTSKAKRRKKRKEAEENKKTLPPPFSTLLSPRNGSAPRHRSAKFSIVRKLCQAV